MIQATPVTEKVFVKVAALSNDQINVTGSSPNKIEAIRLLLAGVNLLLDYDEKKQEPKVLVAAAGSRIPSLNGG